MTEKEGAFEQRRQLDPQGLIDDLVAQTARQGQHIFELNKRIAELSAAMEKMEKQLAKQAQRVA